MSSDAPIGVFDSGVGGLSVLKALRAELPHENFVYFADTGFAPYGERGDPYVIERSRVIVRNLRDDHRIKALVVACNTATAAAIHLIRAEHSSLPLIGVEPALKPAVALSRTGHIAVMGTRGTLGSAKFRALHASLKDLASFVLVPCDGLAEAIENDNATKIRALCAQYTGSAGRFGIEAGQIDTLVLGCTHYPFATNHLRQLVGEAVRLIDTGEPVARQTKRLLTAGDLLRVPTNTQEPAGRLTLLTSGEPGPLMTASKWLG